MHNNAVNQNSAGVANCLKSRVYNQNQILQCIEIPSVWLCMEQLFLNINNLPSLQGKTGDDSRIWREVSYGVYGHPQIL